MCFVKKNLLWFSCVIAANLFLFSPAVNAEPDVCSRGTGLPPFLGSGVDPNLLLVLDNSGSMLDMAYIDDNSQCFDESYDTAKQYSGNFEMKSWYQWKGNPGNVDQWTTGTCYSDGEIVYGEGAFYAATCQENNCDTNITDTNTSLDGCKETRTYLSESLTTAVVIWDSPTAPEWNNSIAYPVGSFVTYNKQVYKATSAVDPLQYSVPPSEDTGKTHWTPVDYTWDGNKAYSDGDLVSFKGMIFEAEATIASGRGSASLFDDRSSGVFPWKRLDEGYFEKIDNIANDSCTDPSYSIQDVLQITLNNKGSKISGTTPLAADEVTCFRATGNFLNWASASKFDIQKKILTGGKYSAGYEVKKKAADGKEIVDDIDNTITTDTGDDRLIQESRGCAGKSFVKQISLNAGADATANTADDVRLTLRIGGSSDKDQVDTTDDRARIDIFAVTVGGYDNAACQTALTLLQEAQPNLPALEEAVFNCVYGADSTVSQQIESLHNKSVMDCWKIHKGDAPPFSGALKTHCQSIYDGSGEPQLTQQYPWAISKWDPFYICAGEYDKTMETKGEGYIGRCWAELPSSTCSVVTCEDNDLPPIITLNSTGDGKYRCSPEKETYKCTKNVCQEKDWYKYFEDIAKEECSPTSGAGTRVCEVINEEGATALPCWTLWTKPETGYIAKPVVPAEWNKTGGGNDACIEYAEYDYCQSLALPEVIDPSDQVFATGDTYNIPAALIDTGLYNQLTAKKPLLNMSGYLKYTLPVDQNSATSNTFPHDSPDRPDGPRGVLYDVAEDLRIGVMALNDNGAKWECTNLPSDDPTIVKYCPDSNKDGARVITQIDEGMSKILDPIDPSIITEDWQHYVKLTTSINDTRANAWTPLAEAMYTALSYYGQNKVPRIDPLDLTDYKLPNEDTVDDPWTDPVQYWCQDNHVLIITEGASTADVNATVAAFANQHGESGETNEGVCANGLNGSPFLDNMTYFGQNATVEGETAGVSDLYSTLIATNKPAPEPAYAKQPVTTHIITTGSLRTDGTGECSPATLMTNAADNGGSTLLTGEDPAQLEANLKSVLSGILGRASAGSAASVISSSRSGEGAVYQAVFWPKVDRALGEAPLTWIGDVHGLFIDNQGRMWDDSLRDATLWSEDKNGNGRLDAGEDIDPDGTGPEDANECLDGDRRIFFYYDGENSKICFNDSVLSTNPPVCNTAVTDYCQKAGEPLPIKSFDNYLWSANQELQDIVETNLHVNRPVDAEGRWVWNSAARYIFTWNDLDNNGIVDSNGAGGSTDEIIPLDDTVNWTTKTTSHHSILDDFKVATADEMGHLRDWLRGLDTWYEVDTDNDNYLDSTEDLNNNGVRDYVYRCRRGDCDPANAAANPEWRLGDVVHSTPKLVAQPAEAFHTIYRDPSYSSFVKRHRFRRNVIYFGANDGMLHAVNGGFYNEDKNKFYKNMDLAEGTGITTYNDNGPELGTEMWAYIPYNLQPHLKCLTDPLYGGDDGNSHKYFVDKEPRIFDMRIFTEEPVCATDPYDKNCVHPKGWGTILVGAMRFGGASITAGTEGTWESTDNRQFISSYFILDITDPERPPKLLGELTRTTENVSGVPLYADLGFSTPMPTGVVMRGSDGAASWYLVFGNGPTTIKGENSQKGKVAVLPMKLNAAGILEKGFRIPAQLPSSSTGYAGVIPVQDSATDTKNRFISDLMTVDYDLESKTDPTYGALYKSDAVYFGTVDGTAFTEDVSNPGVTTWTGGGGIYRLVTRKTDADGKQIITNPDEWYLSKFVDTKAPVTAGLSVGWDYANFWVYFGTGRYFATEDKTDATVQRFFAVKEPLYSNCEMTWGPVGWSGITTPTPTAAAGLRGLVRTDNIKVVEKGTFATYPDPVVFCPSGTNSTDITLPNYCRLDFIDTPPLGTTDGITYYRFEDLRKYIAGEGRETPSSCLQSNSSIGVDGWYRVLQDSRERVTGQSALLGGLVTFTTYQPFDDLCIAEGMSNLYGVHYQTGTAWYENVFGTVVRDSRTVVLDKLSLGVGLATTPSMHSGGGGMDAKAFIQSSTGEIIEIEQENLPIQPPKSGAQSWCDDCD